MPKKTITKKTALKPELEAAVDTGFNKKSKKGIIIKVTIVVLIIISLTGLDVTAMYKLGWKDSFSRRVALVLRLPAGSVNGHKIKMVDYIDDLKILKTAIEKGREGVDGNLDLNNNFNEKIFSRLVYNTLVKQELARYNEAVTKKELNGHLDKVIAQLGGQDKAKKSINDIYNISISAFKNKILLPLMAKEKLQKVIVKDDKLKITKTAKDKAMEVLRLAQEPGVDFAVLARQYSDDETGLKTGGDIGWVTPKQAGPQFSQVLFNMAEGEVYNGVIINDKGFSIVKVTQKLVNDDTGDVGIRVSQIFISVDIDKYIKELAANAEVVKLVK